MSNQIPVAGAPAEIDYPPAPKHPVTQTFHGVEVTDNYQWLEDPKGPGVAAWVAAENKLTRSILDTSPVRATIEKELTQELKAKPVSYQHLELVAGKVFAMRFDPARDQPELLILPSIDDTAGARILLDPLKLDAHGHTAIDWYKPSPNGKLVAVSLSRGGSESGDVHVYDVETGEERTGDVIPRVNGGTAGGSVAWNADNSGFFYTRYPRLGERDEVDLDFYQQIYFHKLGTKTETDKYELGKEFPRIAEIQLESSDDGSHVLARVANGDGGEFMFFEKVVTGGWLPVATYADEVTGAHFADDNTIFLLSIRDAPRGKILHLEVGEHAVAKAKLVIPESDVSIADFLPSGDRLYVNDLDGGISQIRVFTAGGHAQGLVPLEPVSAVDEMKRLHKQDLLFTSEGYLGEPHWQKFAAGSKKVQSVPALTPASTISYADAEVIRDFAVSKDGTKIPVNIIRKKGVTLDGANPTLLYAYGGYSISLTPRIYRGTRTLLNHGFVFAVANLRGGGEYGEEWHRAGNLTRKQNVFDDFYAAAQYLVQRRYSAPEHLGIMGGSNGGLLMGAALTQHPEMYRVVLAFVGIYDMLRVELSPNGAFNVTEFGTVKEQDQFRALYSYSPYHHVKAGVTYPATIFLTGDNDPRVDPANSRKMAAAMQAAGPSKGPILLRTSSNAGHGIGSSLTETIAQFTDAFTFLFDQLAVR